MMEVTKIKLYVVFIVLGLCIVLGLFGSRRVDHQMYNPYYTWNTIRKLKCCEVVEDHKLEVLCWKWKVPHYSVSTNCSCTEYMMCKLVMVTGISSNHFKESKAFFGSVHEHMPNTKIIVYDLGLTDSQVSTLQTYCNVEIRKFNFQKYPEYFKNLLNYAWKTAIAKEMSEEFELFFYCDSSVRLKNSFSHLLPLLLRFPFVPCSVISDLIVGRTHDGMLKYLHMNMTRSELAKVKPSIQAGVYMMWVTPLIKEKLLVPWIDCGMHKDCISPEGATLRGCHRRNQNGSYIGCHRYDQSAMNMILIREFGAPLFATFNSEKKYTNFVVRINRRLEKDLPLICTIYI